MSTLLQNGTGENSSGVIIGDSGIAGGAAGGS